MCQVENTQGISAFPRFSTLVFAQRAGNLLPQRLLLPRLPQGDSTQPGPLGSEGLALRREGALLTAATWGAKGLLAGSPA